MRYCISLNDSWLECVELIPVTNATSAPAVVVYDPIDCIQDPNLLFLLISLVDLAAFLIPCASRSSYPVLRSVLFALNLGAAANLVLAVNIAPSWGLSLLTTFSIAALGVLLYGLFETWSLFIALLAAISMAMWNLQDFTQEWFEHLLGIDYISVTVVNIILFSLLVLSWILTKAAKSLKFVEWLADSGIYAALATFATQYLVFYTKQNWSRSNWSGSGFFPDAYELCCDDVHVSCPIWITPWSIGLYLGLFVVRLSISTVTTDLNIDLKTLLAEEQPLITPAARNV